MIRKARIKDVREIQNLLGIYAKKEMLLPRSLSEIYDHLRDFFVCFSDDQERTVIGCAALHICWEDLGEIRSLAVDPEYQYRGLGNRLVQSCITEARELGIMRLFVLTYQEAFFRDIGFKQVDKSVLPHKIWGDCIRCPKFPDCDEIAMIKDLNVINNCSGR